MPLAFPRPATTGSAALRALSLATVLAVLAPRPAAALVIDVTYGASVTSSGYATQLEAAFDQVADAYQGMFTNPITVTIDVEAITSGLGQSVTSVLGPVSYSSWYNALASDGVNAVASHAAASLSPTQQAVGTGIRLTTANARALGLYPATGLVAGTAPDSTLSFNAAVLDYTGTGQPGLYDVFAVASHELDEALGLNSALSGIADNGALPVAAFAEDEFRYTAPGVHSFSTNPAISVWFSGNGGTTDLAQFNQINGFGDRNDWAFGGCLNDTALIQDAITCQGQAAPRLDTGSAEVQVLGALGYDVAVPEPASLLILAAGLCATLGTTGLRRRVKARRGRFPPC